MARKPKFETWVADVIRRLTGELNLQQWRIRLVFDEEDESEPNCTAFTQVDTTYMTSYVTFTPNARYFWDSGMMEPLIECVTHEIMHIHLEQLHNFAKQAATPHTLPFLTDILEQANQRLTRIVIDLLPPKFFSR